MPPAATPDLPAPDATGGPVAALLRRLTSPDAPPFALLRRRTPGRDADTVEVMTGPVRDLERLADIPDRPGERLGALALVPFRQLTERGFDVVDDGTPLTVLLPHEVHELPVDELLPLLPDHAVEVRDEGFDLDDEAYARTVRRVLDEEIATGEGANFVIRRTFRGSVDGYRPADALVLFRRLLTAESGAYWTFVVHTGRRTLVGAGPEVHVRTSGGTVVMNPVSGTYRYPQQGPDPEGLLTFLADGKERDELSMVVDEELKMMCAVADGGGTVIGPRLVPMAHLAHTEYELRGRTTLDPREVLRRTMFAATVTGSPVRNACRVISRHEADGRGYYAGALALLGRDEGGARTLDSPILIRTADIDAATGRLRVGVGATLVRGSDPWAEVAETHAKAAGVLTALGVRPGRAAARAGAPSSTADPRVRAALDARRAGLAPFWLRLRPQGPDGTDAPADASHRAAEAEVLVVDAEDDFTTMLAHVLRATGRPVRVVPVRRLAGLPAGHRGPVVLGPGPGDPADPADRRIGELRRLAADLLTRHRGGLVGVCLGHQLLASALGLRVARLPAPAQGLQRGIELFGRRETVGFYNSFTARCDDTTAAELAARGVAVARDEDGDGVLALRGPGFAGVQFHPESVLTLDGPRILDELLTAAARRTGVPAG
ncbi:anthranilate synthase family protein [Streptomyces spiramenti]|uniref:anthranilate synthase n=1 Tax=Streptomyces spiramenti TaxID=2720606 RepID=A0ABX1ASP2_9ACTN|nr:anthranilate synthase family protein [Streptomyces spiramenti]NJP68458.1 phenazine-specific anthranilate synthase component I [Streptomyces spiramenti]